LDFKRLSGYKPDYRDWSFFGGHSGGGIRLGVSAPYISSAEGKARFKKALGVSRVASCPSGDGKVTWEEYFSHPDTPGVIFTIYDWKGGMSCGFGINKVIMDRMTPVYAEKLNRMLAQLVSFTLGG
jgi:hypothetical protein